MSFPLLNRRELIWITNWPQSLLLHLLLLDLLLVESRFALRLNYAVLFANLVFFVTFHFDTRLLVERIASLLLH